MQVFQIRMKLYFLQDVELKNIQTKVTAFLDSGFAKNEKFLTMHEENYYKSYCYDIPYAIDEDKIYKRGKIYTLTIRTINSELAQYFCEKCINNYTTEIKGLTAEIRIIPKKIIESIYSLTPVVLKDDEGYWRGHMNLEEFEKRLKENLIKKWNFFEKEKLDEEFELYTLIEFMNRGPIPILYKDVKLLGDKIRLQIADNQTAQNLAYMAVGTGVCEMNSRGAGFVNYRWL